MLKNTLRNNISKYRRFSSSSSSSSSNMPFGLTPKKYMYGVGITFVTATGYTYYKCMREEHNKYRPYRNFLESCYLGICISPMWLLTMPPISIYVLFVEINNFVGKIMFHADKLDREYEKKQISLEKSEEKE